MKHLLRPLWFVLLLALATWLIKRVPGYAELDDSTSFQIGKLLRDAADPLALLLAAGAALVFGGWRGVRAGALFLVGAEGTESESLAASKSLAAGARGLLWGAFLLNSIYVISFYWPEEPWESAGLLAGARRSYVSCGAFLATTLGCLVLLPCAERAAELSGRPDSKATRVARATDVLALLGLFVWTWVLLLSVFVYRVVLGGESSGLSLMPPALDRIDLPFVLWSGGVVFVLPWIALLATHGPRALIRSRDLLGHLARMSLAAGVLVATLVEVAGLQSIAHRGGQGNPAELQALVGRMLVPVVLGIAGAACMRVLPALSTKGKISAQTSA
jgi:hypothetical protein